MTNLHHLPDDVYIYILKFIKYNKNVLLVRLVNKRLKSAVDKKYPFIFNIHNCNKGNKLLKKFDKVKFYVFKSSSVFETKLNNFCKYNSSRVKLLTKNKSTRHRESNNVHMLYNNYYLQLYSRMYFVRMHSTYILKGTPINVRDRRKYGENPSKQILKIVNDNKKLPMKNNNFLKIKDKNIKNVSMNRNNVFYKSKYKSR